MSDSSPCAQRQGMKGCKGCQQGRARNEDKERPRRAGAARLRSRVALLAGTRESGGPDGALERPASQEGDLGMAGVRGPRVRDRRRGRDGDPGRRSERRRRVGTGRAHPRRRLPEARRSSRCSSRAAPRPRTTPRSRRVVADVQHRLSAVPYTKNFDSPYAPAIRRQISADGHSALLRFEIAGDQDQAEDRVGATLDATGRRAGRQPRLHRRAGRRRERQQGAERRDQRATSSRRS